MNHDDALNVCSASNRGVGKHDRVMCRCQIAWSC